jgi:hypothetical protein
MNVNFTSKETVEQAVKKRITELSAEEKEKLIRQAREEDVYNLQIEKSDEEILQIMVKYELFQDQN